MDNSGSDRRPIGDNSPKEEFNIMMVSDSIKEEEGAYAMADQCSEEVRNTLCPTEEFNTVMVSDSIKEEREALPIADPCSEEVKIASCPAEEEFNIVMVSDSIKEEREACPMTDQCSEDVKNTFCLAVTEEEFSTVMVSDSIKEEREACPMAEQCAEEVKYSFCPAGMVDIASFSTNVKKEEDYSLDRQFSEMNGGIANFVDGPGPAASASDFVGDAETQPPSDSNTSESVNIAPVRRRARPVPLPDLSQDSDDMWDEGHTPSSDARSTVMQESQPQLHSTPRRRPQYAGTQHVEAGSNGKWSSEGQAAATTVCAEASGITTSAAADGSPGPTTSAAGAGQPSQCGLATQMRIQNLEGVVTKYRQLVVIEEEKARASTSLSRQRGLLPILQCSGRRHNRRLLQSTATWAWNSRRHHSSSSTDRLVYCILHKLALIRHGQQNLAWEMAKARKKLDAHIDNFY
ncbi:uncharacterized protein [Pleurodeles waltl]|uniref:uncharacterized protein isoform X4 n=1 Tax=Pleurodeles waltl TaxID=8319 RepID=UPI0037095FC5